jgi:hypothetical protein
MLKTKNNIFSNKITGKMIYQAEEKIDEMKNK